MRSLIINLLPPNDIDLGVLVHCRGLATRRLDTDNLCSLCVSKRLHTLDRCVLLLLNHKEPLVRDKL